MQCATKALGTQPPVQLGFPDGELGHYAADPSRLVQLGMRLHAELQRLRPDALVTWGADGGPPHPDHKLVSDVVTQLVRAGAPGVPERLFYAYISAEGMRVMNPARGAPPFAVPLAKYFTVHIPFTPADFEAARRSMACHRTQYSDEILQRVTEASRQEWNGVLPLVPLLRVGGGERFVRVPVADGRLIHSRHHHWATMTRAAGPRTAATGGMASRTPAARHRGRAASRWPPVLPDSTPTSSAIRQSPSRRSGRDAGTSTSCFSSPAATAALRSDSISRRVARALARR